MGVILDKIKAMDPDEVLAYQTIKLVKIRDRRLGAIHHILQLGIFLYIVVYTIIIQKRYLKSEIPTGSFRATAQQMNPWIDASTLPYCTQNQTYYRGFQNNACAYYLGLDITYPPAMMDSILVATRVKDTTFAFGSNVNNSANCSIPPGSPGLVSPVPLDINCAANPDPKAPATQTFRYYTAAIENYTIYIEHAIFGLQNRITVSNKDSKGALHYRDKGFKDPYDKDIQRNLTDKAIKAKRGGDIFNISTLLTASNVRSLDVDSGTGSNATLRYDGILLMMVIEYGNEGYSTSELRYDYYLYQIPGVSVIAQMPSVLQTNGFTQRTWYGVRIIFVLAGTIGKFDFPTLLTALVNGMVLVKLAATVVDILLLHVMPDKALYAKHKFETTEDFSDMRNKRDNEMGKM